MKKHKFTWIDGLVLAVVLLLAAGAFVRLLVLNPAGDVSEITEFQYQLRIQGIRQCTVDALQVGDTVYDNAGKGNVGEIAEISVTPAKGLFYAPDGTVQETEYESRYDVVLTLTASGTPENGGYQVGTYTLKQNQTSLYFTRYSIWNATIISIG